MVQGYLCFQWRVKEAGLLVVTRQMKERIGPCLLKVRQGERCMLWFYRHTRKEKESMLLVQGIVILGEIENNRNGLVLGNKARR